MKSAKFNKFI